MSGLSVDDLDDELRAELDRLVDSGVRVVGPSYAEDVDDRAPIQERRSAPSGAWGVAAHLPGEEAEPVFAHGGTPAEAVRTLLGLIAQARDPEGP